MGRRGVPRRALSLALCLVPAAALITGCGGGSDAEGTSPSPTGSSSTPRATATASPTPDPLAERPGDAAAALEALEAHFGAQAPSCTDGLQSRWSVTCAAGDFDGDSAEDLAMLVPLASPGLRSPRPAIVVVSRAASEELEPFPLGRNEVDASEDGLAVFSVVDRTGDMLPELVYLSKACTASTCKAVVEIQTWDGTAWRDIGPADLGIENLEHVEFTGTGAASQLVMRGGHLASMGAGPTRARTVTYAFDGTRYAPAGVRHDPPEYLYHAILDADALFDEAVETHGQFDAAIAAYRAAILNTTLKDWKYESEGINGRAQLISYAMFRIAVATAANGQNPTAALDEVITSAEEEIFRRLATAFRQGYQQGARPEQGCIQVTSYLALDPLPAKIDEMFDYGTANPRKTTRDICPL